MPKMRLRKKKNLTDMFDNKPNITIGADPELFLYNTRVLKFESVHLYLKGYNKWHTLAVPRGAIQADGVAAEFNITPATSRQEWMKSLNHVQRLLARYIANQNADIQLVAAPTVYFEPKYFASLPADVRELGCNPDYNAYTGLANKKPETDKPMRTGSGHVHIGWLDNELENPLADQHFAECCKMTEKLDWLLYNSSLFWDQNEERRELYGQPGAFRPKKYGLEYRVLSCAWLNNPQTKMFVFDAAKAITSMYLANASIDTSVTPKTTSKEAFLVSVSKQKLPNINSYLNG